MQRDENELAILRERERLDALRSFLFVCAMYLSLPLFAVFWGADWIYVPDFAYKTLGFRSLVIPACFLVYLTVKRQWGLRVTQIAGTIYTFTNATIITAIVFLSSEGIASPYYAGLNLITIGIATFVPWTTGFLILNMVSVYIAFLAASYFFWESSKSTAFTVNLFFCVSTVVISAVIRFFNEKLRMAELHSRKELQQEISQRNEVITTKTNEAVKLSKLSSQFSPQVVHSIKNGGIALDAGIHRALICAIFIDIVNSTERVARIDKADINRVISMFMDDTMKVLLKYDITIDKFLGDGVLAFSNDPIQYADFSERVLHAALEIRSTITNKREVYQDYWLRPLEIKTGIAQGFASVGFYGSGAYFRSYTAIGPVINLASRLCSVAEPNQILVSRDVVRPLEQGQFDFSLVGEKTLKGFESDVIKVYELKGTHEAGVNQDVGVVECPKCSTIMHLETTGGIFKFKCRQCNHELADRDPTKKAA